jgi:hypothetical protein
MIMRGWYRPARLSSGCTHCEPLTVVSEVRGLEPGQRFRSWGVVVGVRWPQSRTPWPWSVERCHDESAGSYPCTDVQENTSTRMPSGSNAKNA